jgi:hydrogenase-4 membrane subunit HyfE
MHLDPEKVGRAIAVPARDLGIQSEAGKLLFGLESLLTLILLLAVGVFAAHDVIMVSLKQVGGEAMEALKLTLTVFVFSMFCVLIRERIVRRIDK